ncbi:helix-turn-helix domain-containing protein [Phyllobacterium calauticae]|jgi:transcriptional regulator with XRE-family HTH domain|uniref:helix-turn-helix domain-containing protein n=1 Tax=Phyllobacterium calauticae TaxID=2817027 RepID=UPI001CBCA840|nr:helix-turn-helix transcriptional regulator [Phyllobacterium calauticae]MBZ3691016.1 helix-turn-helix transcriptional regulator [Phyllobacterium calauticae]
MSDIIINLPAIRKALNLTQTQLAVLAGVDLSTVWRWENHGVPTRGPAKAFIDRLASDASKIAERAA